MAITDFASNQFMFGVSVGFIITGGICALTAIMFRYLENRKKEKKVPVQPIEPILSLIKDGDGTWYIESAYGEGIDMQPIDDDQIEIIIADYIASQVGLGYPVYSFDIQCSNGDEYNVNASKKTVMDEGKAYR